MAGDRPGRADPRPAGRQTGGSAMKVSALDHTLGHDPERQELIFTADDRLAIARRLDRLGIDYIDAGCPSADRRAREFFDRARQECNLKHASLVASVRMDAIRESLARDSSIQMAVDEIGRAS